MPDEMDRVQEVAEQFREDTLAKHKRQRPTGPSLDTCCVCEQPIPTRRQKAVPGCCKCIVCQTEFELMHI